MKTKFREIYEAFGFSVEEIDGKEYAVPPKTGMQTTKVVLEVGLIGAEVDFDKIHDGEHILKLRVIGLPTHTVDTGPGGHGPVRITEHDWESDIALPINQIEVYKGPW